jgi:hypothetical protein
VIATLLVWSMGLFGYARWGQATILQPDAILGE